MSFAVPNTLASPADFAAWTQTHVAPANIMVTLRACSELVLAATRTARYETDELGFATDINIKNALRDAACIQASAWVALSIDPATGGALQSSKTLKRKKIGTAELEYSEVEVRTVTAARAAAYTALVPEAQQYLRTRGLVSVAVGHS